MKDTNKEDKQTASSIKYGDLLSDEQCDEFRRLPVSFNDMVRAIHKAGYEQAMEMQGEKS